MHLLSNIEPHTFKRFLNSISPCFKKCFCFKYGLLLKAISLLLQSVHCLFDYLTSKRFLLKYSTSFRGLFASMSGWFPRKLNLKVCYITKVISPQRSPLFNELFALLFALLPGAVSFQYFLT